MSLSWSLKRQSSFDVLSDSPRCGLPTFARVSAVMFAVLKFTVMVIN